MPPPGWRRAAALAAALLSACDAVAAPSSPPSLEEVLREQRRLGSARFSPDGARILLGLERQDRPSRGAPWRLASTEAVVWQDGRLTPIRTDGTGFKPALCAPWSPSGRYVAGLTLVGDQRVAAIWDTRTGRGVALATPTASMCPPWAGERLVVVVPSAAAPALGASRRLAADRQRERWERAWTQDQVEVTVHSANPDFPADPPPPGRLELADPANGESRLIAEGDFHSPTPSPDGRWLAAVALGPPDPAALSKRTGRRGALVIFDLTGGAPRCVTRLTDLDIGHDAVAWDRASQRLLVAGRRRDATDLSLWTLSPGEPPREVALPEGVRLGAGLRGAHSATRPFGWLGDRPAFIGARAGARRARPADAGREYGAGEALGLYVATPTGAEELTGFARQSVERFAVTPQGEAVLVADGALWAVAPERKPRRLTPPGLEAVSLPEERPTFGAPFVPQLAQARVQVLARDARRRLRLLSLSTRTGAVLSKADAEGLVTVSPAGDASLVRRTAGWSTSLARVGAAPTPVLTLNPHWADRPLGAVERFDYQAGGRALTGWIVIPPGPRLGPLPAIVWIYGGASYPLRPPADAGVGGSPTPVFSAQLWAAQGYAVIYPSTPLPAAREADIAQVLADQAVAAVDAAAAPGWVDKRRVGLIGHSFGGFSVAAVLARRSDRFRAGVAMSGPYDFAAAWGARSALERHSDGAAWDGGGETRSHVEQGQIGLAVPPFEAPEAYVRASPLYQAPRIGAPLLLTVGDLDNGATGLDQAERFHAALRRADNPTVLVRYWGQDHVQDDPWAVRDQWRRFTAWFARYLGPGAVSAGDAPPAPDPAPAPASDAPRPRS